MKLNRFSCFVIFFAVLAIFSCTKENPDIPNQEELITTLIYTLTPVNGGSAVVLSFSDLDGDGGNPPIMNAQSLTADTNYNGVLELLNEQEVPAQSISQEVMEEAEDHQVFYLSSIPQLTINYDDMDNDGNPIGLQTNVSTGGSGTGKLSIILRHEPSKTAAGVKEGSIDNAGGETDIEVVFDVTIL